MNQIKNLTSDVLVLGHTPCAQRITSNLRAHQLSVTQAAFDTAPGDDSIVTLSNARDIKAFGRPGSFEVLIPTHDLSIKIATKQIAIAENSIRMPSFTDYGVSAASNVKALSDVQLSEITDADDSIVFLFGLVKENVPVIAKEIMTTALNLTHGNSRKVYILTRNLKVADNGLEALYRETKDAGVVYVKFTDTTPKMNQSKAGDVNIVFEDEHTRESFQITPSLLVVDERVKPSNHMATIASIFKLHTDRQGFIQKENVHRTGVCTNRMGIYAAGPSRGILSPAMQSDDADDTCLEIFQDIARIDARPQTFAEITPRRCVRCLTCLRLCPYSAIELNTRVSIMPDACASCGLCRAECPQQAIALDQFENANLLDFSKLAKAPEATPSSPSIIAFCCSRSAYQAGQMATWMGHPLPSEVKVVDVPCSGGISTQHILGAFKAGASGVLVLTCHIDNCHSEYGNRYAHARVAQIQDLLDPIGIDPKRLMTRTLASNMGFEFAEIIKQFEDELKRLNTE